jgi:hypothetical protein
VGKSAGTAGAWVAAAAGAAGVATGPQATNPAIMATAINMVTIFDIFANI